MLTSGKFLVSFEVPGPLPGTTEGFCEEMNTIYHIIRIILSVVTILTLIRNEKIYQAHKHTHPTNKIRYIISQLIILTLYTSSLILVSYTYRIILRYI